MIRRTVTLIAAALSSTLLLAIEVHAQTPLNRAVLEALRNNVQLLPEDQSPRSARVSDVVTPGDGVSTASGSFAELRFNDGSLGRLGEQVVFWFTSGSRDFRLSNGTVLMLIPPGQGRTHIRTPNAAAGIQGSALFVRYIAETDTTVVGALTDSGIEVFNEDGSQRQQLRGGQMAVAVGDQIEHIYDFDLKTFYETSELIQGLSPLDEMPTSQSADPAVRQVQAEMQSAIDQQPSFPTVNVIGTPSFIQLPEGTPGEFPSLPETLPPEAFPTPDVTLEQPGANNSDVLNSGGEIQRRISDERPVTDVLQNQVEQTILDPRREEQVDPDRANPDRPGGGNDRPGGERPGGGNDYPGNDHPGNGNPGGGNDRPGNGNDNPGGGNDRPGNGNDNPGGGNDRPGNGNDNPGGGNDHPGNGNDNPGGGNDHPGNGNDNPGGGNDRPGNGNGNPGNGNGNPGNGNGNPGNGNPGNGNPGNGNGNPGNGNGNPGNGNPGNGNPGNGNPGNGNPGNGNPGNGNGNPGNGNPGNGNPGNGQGNGGDGNNDRPRSGQGGQPRRNNRPGNNGQSGR